MKVIAFTKIRVGMFIVSLCVLLAGLLGLLVGHGGQFNLGIDFVGGINQQIQIAPVAMTVSYTGSGSAEGVIRNKILTFTLIESGELSEVNYKFNDYNNIQELVTDIEKLENITVDLKSAYKEADTDRLLSSDYVTELNENPMNINIAIINESEIIDRKSKIDDPLASLGSVSIQSIGDPLRQEFIIKLHIKDVKSSEDVNPDDKNIQQEVENKIKELLSTTLDKDTILIKQSNYTGPTFSKELVSGAISSIIVAIFLILIYITFRFKFGYALGAISALLHDIAIMIVIIGAFQLEVTTTTIAAILTVIGYSLNDTIVVYDRIRENFNLLRDLDRDSIINTSITQSLSRTIITSLTTLLAVIAIYIFSPGGMIKDFSFNLIIGILVGTYSSIFIASPIVLSIMNAQEKKKKAKAVVKSAPAPKKK